ncbi:MAG: polysaccharide export protein [Burkholderiales bacterium]|nr:polysaccharide export protein [Burkholderiales bacterium]
MRRVISALESTLPALAFVLAIGVGANAMAQSAPTEPARPAVAGPVGTQPPAAALDKDTDDDYKIGPQDLLEITVYGQPELTRTVQVNSRGRISLPLIGAVDASNRTAFELEQVLAARLSAGLLQNPQVTVFVRDSLTTRFTVEGAVTRPGVFPLKGQTTLLRAMALVGGRSSLGDLTAVRIFRMKDGERQTLTYDLEKIRTGEAEDPIIQNDDLIVVNQSKVRTVLKDSVLSDVMGLINPFSFLK